MPIAVVSLAVRKSKSIHREVDGSSFAVSKTSTYPNGLISYYRGGASGSSGSSKLSGSSNLSSKSSSRSSGSAATGKGLTGATSKQAISGARSSYSSSATLKAVSPATSKTHNVTAAAALLKKSGRGSREVTRSF